MQQPMDSYICGLSMRSESILIRSYLLFAINTFLSNSGTPILRPFGISGLITFTGDWIL